MKIIEGKCQVCGIDKIVDYGHFQACVNNHMQYKDKHSKERIINLILDVLDESNTKDRNCQT